jgi:heat shock protein HslJ
MKSYMVLCILAISLAVLVAGCVQPQTPTTSLTTPPTTLPTPAVPATLAATPVPGNPLQNGTWTLMGIQGESGSIPVLNGTTITAVFGTDGKITGSSGCNEYFSSYQVSGNTMTVGPVGQTKMSCGSPPGVMIQESTYIAMLQNAVTFQVNDTMLVIDTGGNTSLLFEHVVPFSIVGSYSLTDIGSNSSVSALVPGSKITAIFAADGNLTGNGGCNGYFGGYTTSGNSLTIGPIGSTLMYCQDTSAQESFYLSILGNASTYEKTIDQMKITDTNGNMLYFVPA